MQPYQERVLQEKAELDTKIDSLQDFVTRKPVELPVEEWLRITSQLIAMELYSGILAMRIKHFK